MLDYGCGLGDDVRTLRRKRISAAGWDPFPRRKVRVGRLPITRLEMVQRALYYGEGLERSLAKSDIVNLGYVLNVIEDPVERAKTLRRAWSLTKSLLIVTVRMAPETRIRATCPWTKSGDGWVTSAGTFQKFYEGLEAALYVMRTLKRPTLPVIRDRTGVIYVFRSKRAEQKFLQAHYSKAPHGGRKKEKSK